MFPGHVGAAEKRIIRIRVGQIRASEQQSSGQDEKPASIPRRTTDDDFSEAVHEGSGPKASGAGVACDAVFEARVLPAG